MFIAWVSKCARSSCHSVAGKRPAASARPHANSREIVLRGTARPHARHHLLLTNRQSLSLCRGEGMLPWLPGNMRSSSCCCGSPGLLLRWRSASSACWLLRTARSTRSRWCRSYGRLRCLQAPPGPCLPHCPSPSGRQLRLPRCGLCSSRWQPCHGRHRHSMPNSTAHTSPNDRVKSRVGQIIAGSKRAVANWSSSSTATPAPLRRIATSLARR
jgi:hypothetical protein